MCCRCAAGVVVLPRWAGVRSRLGSPSRLAVYGSGTEASQRRTPIHSPPYLPLLHRSAPPPPPNHPHPPLWVHDQSPNTPPQCRSHRRNTVRRIDRISRVSGRSGRRHRARRSSPKRMDLAGRREPRGRSGVRATGSAVERRAPRGRPADDGWITGACRRVRRRLLRRSRGRPRCHQRGPRVAADHLRTGPPDGRSRRSRPSRHCRWTPRRPPVALRAAVMPALGLAPRRHLPRSTPVGGSWPCATAPVLGHTVAGASAGRQPDSTAGAAA
jgi:hypothetical protein